MLAKEKFYRLILFKKIIFLFKIIIIFLFAINMSFADLHKNIINKLALTKTMSFNFQQIVAEKEEVGICFIKYPLLMKCEYENAKGKILISNGKTIAIIKKKYKKIYYYPIKATPLFFILQKDKIINLIRKNPPIEINSAFVVFQFVDEKGNKIKIVFDKNSLDLKGWETKDAYSNNVSFKIDGLKINNQIIDDFFKIPREEDL